MKRQSQKGQAMLEFAILGSLLISLFLAVGYIGYAVTTQQKLHAGARFSAREMAKESTAKADHRATGNYIAQEATKDRFEQLAVQNLEGQLNPTWLASMEQAQFNHTLEDINRFLTMGSQFQKINQITWLYTHTETISNISGLIAPPPTDKNGSYPTSLSHLKFGLGVVYFGNSLTYKLNALAPIARYFGIKDMSIRATSLMPAELPLRGSNNGVNYGLLTINPWITELVQEDLATYPDLIE